MRSLITTAFCACENRYSTCSGRRVVDRERRGAEVDCRHVNQVEFGAIDEHDPHCVASADTERMQTRGDRPHPLRVLSEGDRGARTERAQRDLVSSFGGGDLKASQNVLAPSAAGRPIVVGNSAIPIQHSLAVADDLGAYVCRGLRVGDFRCRACQRGYESLGFAG